MLYLIASIFCSALLGFLFKVFPRYGFDTLQTIVVNYFVCVSCATIHLGHFPISAADFSAPWMPYAVFLSFVFIVGFNAAALTVQYFSVTLSQIMQRMSILLSVPFAVLAYGESTDWQKFVGFLFAIIAIVLINLKAEKTAKKSKKQQLWFVVLPFITWLLASLIEVVFIKVRNDKMIAFGDVSFLSTVFGFAGVLGALYLLSLIFMGKTKFNPRNIFSGILLGIPNYASIYFILQGLNQLEGSFFFPVNNVGVILLTAGVAFFFFKDKFTKLNWVGILCAVLAIWFLGS